jgi:hypothetical protein
VQGGVIDAAVIDAQGRPIEGARVRVTGYQRAHAAEPIDVALINSGPGRYHGVLAGRRGWYDLLVTVELGASRFSRRVTVEMR